MSGNSTQRLQDDKQKMSIKDDHIVSASSAQNLFEMGYEEKKIRSAIAVLTRKG